MLVHLAQNFKFHERENVGAEAVGPAGTRTVETSLKEIASPPIAIRWELQLNVNLLRSRGYSYWIECPKADRWSRVSESYLGPRSIMFYFY